MSETIGGVGTTITPSTQTSSGNDNVPFDITYNNAYQDGALLGIFADNTKTAGTNIALGTGNWNTRTIWPTGSGYSTVSTRWFWSQGSAWQVTSNGPGTTVRVSPTIRMVNVRVWNTTIDGVTTAATSSQFSGLIDNLNRTYSWSTTNSLDSIYGQCSTLSQRAQFRFTAIGTIASANMNTQCSYPFPGLSGSAPYWGLPSGCVDEIYARTTADGANTLNLVVLNNIPENGWHIRGASTSNPTWYVIGLREAWISDAGFIRTLAHELGHWVLYPDSSAHAPTYNCGQSGEPACGSDPARCGNRLSGGARVPSCNSGNNIMCAPTASYCGRAVTSGQCSGAGGDWPFYFADQN